jgi:dihydrofolate reductase
VSRLINTTTMTVDGVTDVGEWYVSEGGHDRAARDQFDGAAGMVIGRKTYEGLAAFWSQETGEWADMLNPMPKFVPSRTLRGSLEWNGTVIEGDAAEGVSRLKDELDGDLLLIGCGELARDLLANGLVDELRFWVHPAVWGEGARPYQGEKIRMRPLESTSFDSGVTLLRYEPVGRPAASAA